MPVLPRFGSLCMVMLAGTSAGCAASGSTGATAAQVPTAAASAVELGPSAAAGDGSAHAIDLLGTPSEAPRAGVHAANTAGTASSVRAVMADTALCHRFHDVVVAAKTKFDKLELAGSNGGNSGLRGEHASAVMLPGAQRCVMVSGGPGHVAVTTYSCEFGATKTSATSTSEAAGASVANLTTQRNALARDLRACASPRALESTRVRIVRSAGTAVLMVNIHDSARW